MRKILLITGLLVSSLFAISNHEVAIKSDEVMRGFEDVKADMTMVLINASGQKRERTMHMQTLELKGGNKSLMEFLTPADVRGTKFLSYEHADRDDDQWLFLPALKRVKRMASKNKSGSFMGSEFSFEDMGSFNIDKYNYKGDATEVELDGKKYLKSEYTPNSKYSGYTKQISYVDPVSYLVHQVDYYDRKKELLKTAIFSQYTKVNGVNRIGKIHMKNFQNDKESILMFQNEKIKNGLKEKDFHKRVLKK